MESTITIDGHSIVFEDPGEAYSAYTVIAAVIRSQKNETVVLEARVPDYRVRHVFHVGPNTVLNASLAYSPVEDVPAGLAGQTLDKLAADYPPADWGLDGG